MSDRTNVLLIVTDTFRAANIGCYGSTDTLTPNIDHFAAGAARFTYLRTFAGSAIASAKK